MKIMLFAGLPWRCSVSHTCSCRFPAPRRRGAKAGSDIGLRSTHRSVCVANHQRTADRRRDCADGCGGTYATAPEVKLRHLRVCLGVRQAETQKCVPRQMRNFGPELLLCDALAIIRYNDLSVEYVPRLRKCQAIGHPMEVAVVFGLLHADCLEEEGFAFHVHTQNSHFPLTRCHLCLPNLKLAPLVQVS